GGSVAWVHGQYAQAIHENEKALALGGRSMVLWNIGYLYGIVGEREKAQQVLDQLLALSEQGYIRRHDIALIYVGRGELDRAFDWLEQAYEQREGILVFLKSPAAVVPGLSADPRLADLLRRIGLPE
ncbi:MAG: hypothetical protein ACRD82_06130, partial [Blastocatellia bacterium]